MPRYDDYDMFLRLRDLKRAGEVNPASRTLPKASISNGITTVTNGGNIMIEPGGSLDATNGIFDLSGGTGFNYDWLSSQMSIDFINIATDGVKNHPVGSWTLVYDKTLVKPDWATQWSITAQCDSDDADRLRIAIGSTYSIDFEASNGGSAILSKSSSSASDLRIRAWDYLYKSPSGSPFVWMQTVVTWSR